MTEATRPASSELAAMEFWDEIFPSAMTDLQSRHSKEPACRVESGHSIRSLTNWSDIYEILEDARDTYDNPKGFRGTVRRGIRKAADHSQLLNSAIEFVPEIDYIKPVLGALKIIANAAKRTTELREEISTSLDALERHFGDIEIYILTFPGDRNISTASVRLVSSMLKAVEDVIGYYIQNNVPKTISALFNGREYKKALTQSLEEITLSSRLLIHQAHASNMWQNRQTFEATQDNSMKMNQILQGQEQAAAFQNQLAEMFAQFKLNLFRKFLTRNFPVELGRGYSPAPTLPPTTQTLLPELYTAQKTLLALLATPCLEGTDMERIRQGRERVPVEDRERAEQMLQMKRFQHWVKAPAKQELLVHGACRENLYTSGLSVICCYLAQAISRRIQFSCLSFFCGYHLDHDDFYAGARGMIRSLISQLLRQQQFDTLAVGLQVDLALVESGEIKQLCELFKCLVHQLPEHQPLFCIIDGIKFFERDQYLDDMSEVLASLLNLTQDERVRCVFKILVTSPSETRLVRQAFEEDCILSVASTPRTGQGSSYLRLERIIHGNFDNAVSSNEAGH